MTENHAGQSTIDDVLTAVNNFADTVEDRFNKVDERFDKIEGKFDKVEGRLTKIEATMVTKDYLDEKLADLRGDLVVLTRKEDTKVKAVIERLRAKNIFDDDDVKHILGMEPFAQTL